MKASELRVGNLVTVARSLPHEVTAYHLFMMETYKPAENEASYEELTEPIPLTEEWLIKMGFLKHIPSGSDSVVYYINYEGKTVIGYWLVDGAVNIGDFIPKNIKYVHQLQNLYFALTGEELAL